MKTPFLVVLLSITAAALPAVSSAAACSGKGLEVQVLGSGGPELLTKRASTSYLVRLDGKPRLLVDSGGGSALRFAEAGATVGDLDAILFSHLHIDHTADFAALVKSSYFQTRTRPLAVFGPGGNAGFPSTTQFVSGLFNPKTGLYRYLGDYLTHDKGGYRLQVRDIKPPKTGALPVPLNADLSLSAVNVIHGSVPALAWRVDAGASSVVFTGDGNGDNGQVQVLAKNAGLLVAHDAIGDDAKGPPRALHMPPTLIGKIAGEAGVHDLVMGHRMQRELGHEDETRTEIASNYSGPLSFADDLDCYAVAPAPLTKP